MMSSLFHARMQRHPTLLVWAFVVLMSVTVIGLAAWKAAMGRQDVLARNEEDIRNLAHSLIEHAAHSLQATDVALSGVTDLLKYRRPDNPERLNAYLASTVRGLSQLREIKVLDADGNAIYSSADGLVTHNNSDRDYFRYHRANADPALQVSGPFESRTTGLPTLVLSKRITNAATGEFAGIVMGSILCEYFANFYTSFNVGERGGISLITNKGKVLVHWPSGASGFDLSASPLFRPPLSEHRSGFGPTNSPFDGVKKYFAFERSDSFPIVVTVARSEDEILAAWRSSLLIDALVAAGLVLLVMAFAALLARQFSYRTHLEQSLREREARHRLLADNIADIVVVLDTRGICRYVSHSVQTALGMDEDMIVGRSCFSLVLPADRAALILSARQLAVSDEPRSISFRVRKPDGRLVWLEANFRRTRSLGTGSYDTVAVLRDITGRKGLEEELSTANRKLAQLATTDGLTGLANRRSFDAFLREAYRQNDVLSVLMIDIDHFKSFNDSLGHLAGDACLREIAAIIDGATTNTGGQSARYGGEEFAIVLPGVAEERAVLVANSLRMQIRKLSVRHPAAPRGYVTISVGVAAKHAGCTDDIALVRDADIALYQAKESGRNCAVASSSLRDRLVAAPPLAAP